MGIKGGVPFGNPFDFRSYDLNPVQKYFSKPNPYTIGPTLEVSGQPWGLGIEARMRISWKSLWASLFRILFGESRGVAKRCASNPSIVPSLHDKNARASVDAILTPGIGYSILSPMLRTRNPANLPSKTLSKRINPYENSCKASIINWPRETEHITEHIAVPSVPYCTAPMMT